MKTYIMKACAAILALALLLALAACGAETNGPSAEPRPAEEQTEKETVEEKKDTGGEETAENGKTDTDETGETRSEEETAETAVPGKKTLVVYFSATGTTKGVAEMIAAIEDADLYEIRAAVEYTDADLNWHDSRSRTSLEQNDKTVRPEIGSGPVELKGYERIYVGFPIWWGEEPRILDTFAESCDFTGITVIPFCTSSSSGIGRSGLNLAECAGSGNWLEGRRFGAGASEEELRDWIESLK